MYIKNNKGFSLIEILVTVGLIGILVSIAVPSYRGYKRNTIKMSMRADVGNGQKVYGAKYAVDSSYCYKFADVGLSTNKGSSPIYKNKGFYGFGILGATGDACGGFELTDAQFISAGEGKCSISGHSDKTACEAASQGGNSGIWTVHQDTAGQNAASCVLATNQFLIGSYTDTSSLNTFIQIDDAGILSEKSNVKDCFTP